MGPSGEHVHIIAYTGQVLVDGTWCRRRSAPSWRHGLEISAILAQHAVVEVRPLMVEAGDGDVTTGISLDEPIPPGGWAYLAPPAGASPAWS